MAKDFTDRLYDGDISANIGYFLGIVFLLVVGPVVSGLFSGFGAMVAGWAFGDSIRGVWRAMGVNLDQFSFFDIGVALGFAASFLRSGIGRSK